MKVITPQIALLARLPMQRVGAGVSAGADTKANTWRSVRGRGVLEVGDPRLLEDGGERQGALGSDLVVVETGSDST